VTQQKTDPGNLGSTQLSLIFITSVLTITIFAMPATCAQSFSLTQMEKLSGSSSQEPPRTESTEPQDSSQAQAKEEQLKDEGNPSVTDTITVTGSLLISAGATATLPVTTYTNAAIRDSGAHSVGDFLGLMPYIEGKGIGAATNVNGRGTSSINLRGLDSARTLILINGRRMIATNNLGASLAVDLNNIPMSMVDRIEVLRGGASSVYGSDAIAGVVNIILRDHFDGTEVGFQGGETTAGDGRTGNFSIVTGRHSAHAEVLAGLEYFDRGNVYAGDRELFEVFLQERGSPPSVVPGGSGVTGSPRADSFIIPAQGTAARPFTIQDAFNTAPLAYLQTPQRRLTFSLITGADIGDRLRSFAELTFASRESNQLLGPFPLIVGPNELNGSLRQLLRDNPYNTFPNAHSFGSFFRRTVEAGSRSFEQESETTRLALGVKSKPITGDASWNWATSYVYGQSRVKETITGRPHLGRLAQALDTRTCSTSPNPPPGVAPCVNLFFPGSLRPIDVDWIIYTDHSAFSTRQHVLTGVITGDVWKGKPLSSQVAAGIEVRREEAEDYPDPVTAAGLTAGSQRDPMHAGYTVAELFGEARIPVLTERPFARELTLETGARYSSVNRGDNPDALTYRLGMDWRPFDSWQVTAAYATAFRSPNVNELFLGRGRTFAQVGDVCGNLTINSDPAILANCTAQGVPLNMIPAFSFETPATSGGNKDLRPETSTTRSIDLAWSPSTVNDFRISLNWFSISIDEPIAITSVPTIYDECYRRGNSDFCKLVTRDPLNGQMVEVRTTYLNQSFIRTSGFDFSVGKRLSIKTGRGLELNLDATYLSTFEEQAAPHAAVRSRVGYIEPAGGAFPQWRGSSVVSYDDHRLSLPFTFSWAMRYIGELSTWRLRDLPSAANAQPRVPAYFYHDLAVSCDLRKVRLSAGVANLFDKKAPYYTGAPDTNTDVETYDVVGRRFFARALYAF
jgi:iron complex outermembrane receptor protein